MYQFPRLHETSSALLDPFLGIVQEGIVTASL